MKKSFFITIEGGEGSGKTTLIKRLKELFSEEDVVVTREPGSTSLGEKIRQLLLEKDIKTPVSPYAELSLFLAARAQHIEDVIRPALNNKKIVICDRYNDSTIAYQGYARELGVEKVKDLCDFISQGVTPNVTFYLDIEPSMGLERIKAKKPYDRIESEKILFHQKIREGFLQIAKEEPGRFHVIDATSSPEDVFSSVESLIKKIM
jgi:dTMP kinase